MLTEESKHHDKDRQKMLRILPLEVLKQRGDIRQTPSIKDSKSSISCTAKIL